MAKKFYCLILFLLSQIFVSCGFAYEASNAVNSGSFAYNKFQFVPALNFWGYAGRQTLGKFQGLLAVFGDQGHAFYIAGEGKVGATNNGWSTGLGAGYRKVIDQRILGGYLFLDYNDAPIGNGKFFILNPGVESLGMDWDFRINGYIPYGSKKWSIGKSGRDFEDNLGIYDDVRFTGHTEYDRIVDYYTQENVNIGVGVDAEIGRRIPGFSKLKAYIGGYHFDTKELGGINGVSGRLSYQVNNHISIEVVDTFDNYKRNAALLGVRFTLGGFNDQKEEASGIAVRLLDPIEHNIATAANGYTVPIKSEKNVVYGQKSREVAEHDNLWFFKPDNDQGDVSGSHGSGTFEDPFVGLNKINYSGIDKTRHVVDSYPLLYFAPGAYDFNDFQSRGIDDRFNLPNGWGMYGRERDFKEPAKKNEQIKFLGGLDLVYDLGQGGATNTLNSISLTNDKASDGDSFGNAALYASNAADVILQNVNIESRTNVAETNKYAVGIVADNSTLNFVGGVNNVTAISSARGEEPLALYSHGYGIYAANNAVINFLGGKNNVSGFGISVDQQLDGEGTGVGVGNGIYADHATINFVAGVNHIVGSGDGSNKDAEGGNSYGRGVFAYDGSTINFMGGFNNIIGIGKGAENLEGGVHGNIGLAEGISAYHATINFQAGVNNIFAFGGTSAYGVDATNSIVNFINPGILRLNILVNGRESSYGIYADADSRFQVNGLEVTDPDIIFRGNIKIRQLGKSEGDMIFWENNWDIPWATLNG